MGPPFERRTTLSRPFQVPLHTFLDIYIHNGKVKGAVAISMSQGKNLHVPRSGPRTHVARPIRSMGP